MKHYLVTYELTTEESDCVWVQSEEKREVIEAISHKEAYIHIKGKYMDPKRKVYILYVEPALRSPLNGEIN